MAQLGFGHRTTVAEMIEILSRAENQDAVITIVAPENGETECFSIEEYSYGVEIELKV